MTERIAYSYNEYQTISEYQRRLIRTVSGPSCLALTSSKLYTGCSEIQRCAAQNRSTALAPHRWMQQPMLLFPGTSLRSRPTPRLLVWII